LRTLRINESHSLLLNGSKYTNTMLSNSQIKKIRSLQQKKFRKEHGEFVVEGEKIVHELMQSEYEVVGHYSTIEGDDSELISNKELDRITGLKKGNRSIAVAKMKETFAQEVSSILLDGVNDPGNLGTIIRIADWYGIKQVICSLDTADCYNSKVVQSTMGSLFRINVVYTDLKKYISDSKFETYAAVMDGENVNKIEGAFNLLMGSESHGIREGLDQDAAKRVTIARKGRAESLNVGVATGILLDRLLG
jgi:TrmH family RNA methyltransferase